MSLPKILDDYLIRTEQYTKAAELGIELSEGHLLEEAEWCLYNAYSNEASSAYMDYKGTSKAALRRYVEKQRNKGVIPKHCFEL